MTSAKLLLCTSWPLSDYSSKSKCIKYFTSQADNLSNKIPLQEAKQKNCSICLRAFYTLGSHGCFCFDMPSACGSTDDFPYLLTPKVITNHITSNQQKKNPKCSFNILLYPLSLAFLGAIIGTFQVQSSHLLNPLTLPGGIGRSIKKKK